MSSLRVNFPKLDCKKKVEEITIFLQSQFKYANRKNAIIGVSGGIDSSTVAALCVNALGAENVYLIAMPIIGITEDKHLHDVEELAGSLKIHNENYKLIKINNIVEEFKSILHPDTLRFGNIMARVRMIILYDFAKKENGLVVGTCNKSEILLGYETLHGDGACDLNPIASIYKTQLIDLAAYLNVPKKIIKKKPTAGLWIGQTDEEELGFTYKWVDPLLYLLFDKQYDVEEIVNKFNYTKEEVNKILKIYNNSKFKRCLPPAL